MRKITSRPGLKFRKRQKKKRIQDAAERVTVRRRKDVSRRKTKTGKRKESQAERGELEEDKKRIAGSARSGFLPKNIKI